MLAAFASIATLALAAQAPQRGTLEGRVVDAIGRPLAAAEVAVRRPTGPLVGRAASDADGAWRLTGLEPGPYVVTVSRLGYRLARQDVVLEPGSTVRLSSVLELVPFTLDSLVVSAPAAAISTTDTDLGSKVTVDEIALLPTTLDPRNVIALTPGARPDHIWGGASDQANAYQ
ncbi:MAG: carboxypeptidase-like regulatory domain-containing protein, partial [Gemmatimonadales bacterium]